MTPVPSNLWPASRPFGKESFCTLSQRKILDVANDHFRKGFPHVVAHVFGVAGGEDYFDGRMLLKSFVALGKINPNTRENLGGVEYRISRCLRQGYQLLGMPLYESAAQRPANILAEYLIHTVANATDYENPAAHYSLRGVINYYEKAGDRVNAAKWRWTLYQHIKLNFGDHIAAVAIPLLGCTRGRKLLPIFLDEALNLDDWINPIRQSTFGSYVRELEQSRLSGFSFERFKNHVEGLPDHQLKRLFCALYSLIPEMGISKEEGYAFLERYLRDRYTDPFALQLAAVHLQESGRSDQAGQMNLWALESSPDYLWARCFSARLLILNDDQSPEKIVKEVAELNRISPDHPEAVCVLALIASQHPSFVAEGQVDRLTSILRADCTNPFALMYLGFITLNDKASYDLSIALLTEALKYDSDLPLHQPIGDAYEQKAFKEVSIENFRYALECWEFAVNCEQPKRWKSVKKLGSVHCREVQLFPGAGADLKRGIELMEDYVAAVPEDVEAELILANAHLRVNDPASQQRGKEIIARYRIPEEDPLHALYQMCRARNFLYEGQYANTHLALEASRVAAMRDQTLDAAWKALLAVMCIKTRSISDSEVVRLLRRIINNYPYYPYTYRLLLEMHRAGRTGDALSEATAEELRLRMPAIAPYEVEYLSFSV